MASESANTAFSGDALLMTGAPGTAWPFCELDPPFFFFFAFSLSSSSSAAVCVHVVATSRRSVCAQYCLTRRTASAEPSMAPSQVVAAAAAEPPSQLVLASVVSQPERASALATPPPSLLLSLRGRIGVSGGEASGSSPLPIGITCDFLFCRALPLGACGRLSWPPGMTWKLQLVRLARRFTAAGALLGALPALSFRSSGWMKSVLTAC
mmetsp:Transcript_11493/g.28544  ORF Transcript_11493/g.28544 Transcript_11493/m.28544 type:complete len:209 (+) Transcript_11493:1302-1928(+)